MYKLTEDPEIVVLHGEDGSYTAINSHHRWWAEYEAWTLAGNVAEPASTTEEAVKAAQTDFTNAIQAFMDDKARAAGYDSLITAISYAEEPAVPKFQDEGKVFRAWRSIVWAYANEQLALVLGGQRPQPALADFLTSLPPLELPV